MVAATGVAVIAVTVEADKVAAAELEHRDSVPAADSVAADQDLWLPATDQTVSVPAADSVAVDSAMPMAAWLQATDQTVSGPAADSVALRNPAVKEAVPTAPGPGVLEKDSALNRTESPRLLTRERNRQVR